MDKYKIFFAVLAVVLAIAVGASANESGGIQFLRERAYLRVSSRKVRESREAQELHKLAMQNDANAQFKLGQLYEEGRGVEEDHDKKGKWWHHAAKQGHIEAQRALANLCDSVGDYAEAAEWFCRLAWQGDIDAQYEIAVLYAQGKGVPENEQEACIWLSVSAIGGHSGSGAFGDSITKKWSPDKRTATQAEAKRRYAEIQQRRNNLTGSQARPDPRHHK